MFIWQKIFPMLLFTWLFSAVQKFLVLRDFTCCRSKILCNGVLFRKTFSTTVLFRLLWIFSVFQVSHLDTHFCVINFNHFVCIPVFMWFQLPLLQVVFNIPWNQNINPYSIAFYAQDFFGYLWHCDYLIWL